MLVIGIDHQLIYVCQFPSLKSTNVDANEVSQVDYKLSYLTKLTYVDFVAYVDSSIYGSFRTL